MATTESIERYCNARKKDGSRCRRSSGWGTGRAVGPCRYHGGMLPNVQKHHARLEALSFARGQLGQELDIDPLEGVLVAVRLAYGVVDHWRHKLAENVTVEDRQEYQRALMDYTRICDIAIKAGVSERQIKVVERLGEQLSLVFEETLAAVSLSVGQRQELVAAYARGLARLEGPVVDSTAEEAA